jgi:hypothetical protein
VTWPTFKSARLNLGARSLQGNHAAHATFSRFAQGTTKGRQQYEMGREDSVGRKEAIRWLETAR